MKNRIIILVMCMAAVLFSCKKNIVEKDITFNDCLTDEIIHVEMNFGDDGTKTNIVPNGTSATVTWKMNDRIYVYVNNNSTCLGYLAAREDGKKVVFAGELKGWTGAQQLHFYHLGTAIQPTSSLPGATVICDARTQTGTLDYVTSHHIIYVTKTGVTTENINDLVVTDMQNKISIVRVDLSAFGAGSNITWKGCYPYISIDMKSGVFTSSTYNATLNNVSDTYYVLVAPKSYSSTDIQTLTFDNSDGIVREVELGIESGKYYTNEGSSLIPLKPMMLSGEFSVSKTQKVHFSKGNLMYDNGVWKCHEEQNGKCFNYESDTDISDYYTSAGTFDLFGWGCTGSKDDRTGSPSSNTYQLYYDAWCTSTKDYYGSQYNINRYGYGPDYYSDHKYHLETQYKSDWGYCFGGVSSQWFSLNCDQWKYILETRKTSYGKHYAFVKVNGVRGVLIIPDSGFTWPSDVSKPYTFDGSPSSAYNGKNYTMSEWYKIEKNGAIFLISTSHREGGTYKSADQMAYWTPKNSSSGTAYVLYGQTNSNPNFQYTYTRNKYCGYGVRLVCYSTK